MTHKKVTQAPKPGNDPRPKHVQRRRPWRTVKNPKTESESHTEPMTLRELEARLSPEELEEEMARRLHFLLNRKRFEMSPVQVDGMCKSIFGKAAEVES